ncbi:odorant receptor 13a-like [Diachasmimorpha longicaudata]|uniref:odorant receptor 13a-like n=1 Tax=Diachasmimorpha longicaudata TaxID=58733 RepID=UPI0030B8E1FB
MAYKVFSLDRSYIENNLKILTILGLWNPYNGTQKWLYHIYTILIPLFLLPIRSMGFLRQGVIMHHDFIRSTLSLLVGLAYVYGWVKILNFILNRANIELIINLLNQERWLPCSKETAQYRNKVVTRAIRVTTIFTLAWIYEIFICLPFFYVDECIKSNTTYEDLAIRFAMNKNVIGGMNLRIISILDCLFAILIASTIVSNDCFCLCQMYHITNQLRLLNFRLSQCCSIDIDFPKIETSKKSNTFNFECGSIYSQKSDLTSVGEFICCIQHYQNIVRMVKIINKVYGPILLPQLMTSLMTISFAAIHIFVTKTVTFEEPGSALFIIAVTISCLFQLSAYCWGGDGIIRESSRTSTAVYTCIWYEQDPNFQTNLKIFFFMCRNTLVVNAYGLFYLSLVTLKNVLVKSYSAMALISKANP